MMVNAPWVCEDSDGVNVGKGFHGLRVINAKTAKYTTFFIVLCSLYSSALFQE